MSNHESTGGRSTVATPTPSKLRRLRHSIESTGLVRALCDAAVNVMSYDPASDASFDARHGTDTSGRMIPDELGIDDVSAREQAILYLPSPPRVTRWMLNAVGVAHEDYTFIDLGCGKGRVVLVASEYPFRRVVGVELSDMLVQVARRNVATYAAMSRCKQVEIACMDATTCAWPDGPLLVHLYHPFEADVLRRVLQSLDATLQTSPRPVVIAYLLYSSAIPDVTAVFAEFPSFRQTRFEQSVSGNYDWMFYQRA